MIKISKFWTIPELINTVKIDKYPICSNFNFIEDLGNTTAELVLKLGEAIVLCIACWNKHETLYLLDLEGKTIAGVIWLRGTLKRIGILTVLGMISKWQISKSVWYNDVLLRDLFKLLWDFLIQIRLIPICCRFDICQSYRFVGRNWKFMYFFVSFLEILTS